MPDTPEHRADMHRLATERRKAGLPVWDRKLRLADVWRNESMSFEERRDTIVARIRASEWFKEYDEHDELPEAVAELAEAPHANDFDDVWGWIYDIADVDRVWIETVR